MNASLTKRLNTRLSVSWPNVKNERTDYTKAGVHGVHTPCIASD